MRRAIALAAVLAGCGADEAGPVRAAMGGAEGGSRPEWAGSPRPELGSPCPGSDEAFAFRALRLIEGRRPEGVRELEVLARFVRELDGLGLEGREVVARGLSRSERYVTRWRTFLQDHLKIPRIGSTAFHGCYGFLGPLAEDPRLAAHVRDHAPEEDVPEDMSGWTMADLIGSSLRLDDPTPLLRAHVLAREVRPIGGNNVGAVELERARRVFLGRGFEAAYLGRRLECLACHDGSGRTPLDSAEPARDRTWPVMAGLEDMVYGPASQRDEDRSYAGFRFAGFTGGGLRPWGSEACGGFDPGRGGDLVGAEGFLAGPLPAGAHALDVEARLREGFEIVGAEGLGAAEDGVRPAAALAAMVAINLADAVWQQASGRALTLGHGQPRNAAQQEVLRGLAEALVEDGWSLRRLVVAVAVHPYLDLDEPGRCAEALPPVLEPFWADNDAGDGVRREDPWILIDSAAGALGWRAEKRLPLPYGWGDEALLRALGVYLDDSEPGHRGVDLTAALAWEDRTADASEPGWDGEAPAGYEPDRDVIARLVALARADAEATVEELVIAVQDRVIQETALPAEGRAAIAGLLGLELSLRAGEVEAEALETALRRFAGALLGTPQFTLAGLAPPGGQRAPRLLLPEFSARALCERHAPAIAAASGVAWRCDEEGPRLASGE